MSERTPGRGDFGRWDPMDDPIEGEMYYLFALNHAGPHCLIDGVLRPLESYTGREDND